MIYAKKETMAKRTAKKTASTEIEVLESTPVFKGIHGKLIHLQQAFKAPKDEVNKFGNFNYRKAETMLHDLKPILKEIGCTITLSDRIEMHGSENGKDFVFLY